MSVDAGLKHLKVISRGEDGGREWVPVSGGLYYNWSDVKIVTKVVKSWCVYFPANQNDRNILATSLGNMCKTWNMAYLLSSLMSQIVRCNVNKPLLGDLDLTNYYKSPQFYPL